MPRRDFIFGALVSVAVVAVMDEHVQGVCTLKYSLERNRASIGDVLDPSRMSMGNEFTDVVVDINAVQRAGTIEVHGGKDDRR